MFRAKHMSKKTGNLGEDLASNYLVSKGFKILERNHRNKLGEIDIVVKDKQGLIVFVEVKTMQKNNLQTLVPEDNFTGSKLRKITKAISLFISQNEKLIDEEKGWRIDLIAVELDTREDILTDIHKNCVIRHYENVT